MSAAGASDPAAGVHAAHEKRQVQRPDSEAGVLTALHRNIAAFCGVVVGAGLADRRAGADMILGLGDVYDVCFCCGCEMCSGCCEY